MDLGSLLFSLALLILVAAFVARPLVERTGNNASASAPADELIARREAVLIELRDLDFDHATGKVGDDDYAAQRAKLIAAGAEVLRALDTLKPSQASEPDDEIEKLIAARRKTRKAPSGANFCPNCGSRVHADDKFCAHCGKKITLAPESA